MKYAYYPGCSLECSSAAYDRSVKAVAEVLGIELVEIDDWNCCGATEYFTQDELVACSVIARNLAIVDPQFDQLVAPCAACYLNLKKTDKLMADDAEMNAKINEALAAGGLQLQAGHGPGAAPPGRDLHGHRRGGRQGQSGPAAHRAARGPVLRLPGGAAAERLRQPEYPMKMDELFKWLGAEVVDYPVKAHCCGGHMTQISEPQAFELIRRLLQSAVDYEADLILCMCPMCQLNLDAYQGRVGGFFGMKFQHADHLLHAALGVAFGLDLGKLGFGKELVAAKPVIQAKLDGDGRQEAKSNVEVVELSRLRGSRARQVSHWSLVNLTTDN